MNDGPALKSPQAKVLAQKLRHERWMHAMLQSGDPVYQRLGAQLLIFTIKEAMAVTHASRDRERKRMMGRTWYLKHRAKLSGIKNAEGWKPWPRKKEAPDAAPEPSSSSK